MTVTHGGHLEDEVEGLFAMAAIASRIPPRVERGKAQVGGPPALICGIASFSERTRPVEFGSLLRHPWDCAEKRVPNVLGFFKGSQPAKVVQDGQRKDDGKGLSLYGLGDGLGQPTKNVRRAELTRQEQRGGKPARIAGAPRQPVAKDGLHLAQIPQAVERPAPAMIV